ncbi:hypothetical protein SpCBS45565_g04548 [Spizellomyces sp. 'palustris']|nr:hypothetical protein SpCBS45565_g04548 [Spizellomyces sp. 'palustris']
MVARRSGSVKSLEPTPSPSAEYLRHTARGSSNDDGSTGGTVANWSPPRTQMGTTLGADIIHVDERVRDLCPPPAPSYQTPSQRRSRKRSMITSSDEEDDVSQITAEPSLPVKSVDVKDEDATEGSASDISSASPGLALAEPQQHRNSMDVIVVDIDDLEVAGDDAIMLKIQRLQAKCGTPKAEPATTDPDVIIIEDDDRTEIIRSGQENELSFSKEPQSPPTGEAAQEEMNANDDDIDVVKSERDSNSPKRFENANWEPHHGRPAYVSWSVPDGLEINSLNLSQVVRGILWRHFRQGNGGLRATSITELCVEYFPEHMERWSYRKTRTKKIRQAVRRYKQACGFWEKARFGINRPHTSHGLETPVVQAKPVTYLSPQYYKYLNADRDFKAQKHLFDDVDTLPYCNREPRTSASSHRSLGARQSSSFDHSTLPGAVPIEMRHERVPARPQRAPMQSRRVDNQGAKNSQDRNSHGDFDEIPSTLASPDRVMRKRSRTRRASSPQSGSEDDNLFIEVSSDSDTLSPARRRKRVKLDVETFPNPSQTSYFPTVLERPWADKWNSTKPMIAYTYWQMWNKLGGDNNNTYRNTSFRARQRTMVPYAALVKDKWNPGLPQSAMFAKDPGQSLPEALQKCKDFWTRSLGWLSTTGAVPVFCNLPKKLAGLQLPASYWLYLGPCYLGDVLAKTPFEELSTASRAAWGNHCQQEDVMVEVEILPSTDQEDVQMEQLICDGDCVRRAIEVFGDESVGPDKVVLCDCTPGLTHQRHGAQSRQCCSLDFKHTTCGCYWRTRERVEQTFYQEHGRLMKKDEVPGLEDSAMNVALNRDGTPGSIADGLCNEQDPDVMVKDEANCEDSQDKDYQPNEESHQLRPLFSETQSISDDEPLVIDSRPALEVEPSECRDETNTSTQIAVNGDKAPKEIPTNKSPSCHDEQVPMEVDKVP